MKKTLGIISNRRPMALFYGEVFQELFGGDAEILTGAAEDGSIRRMPPADLYISSITAYDVLKDARIKEYVNETLHPIRMDVTFSRAAVDLLKTYPDGTKALLINQNKHMVMECIAQLYHLGISNIEFYPCYPGIDRLPVRELAFTVGEPDLVPEEIAHVVDIGSRFPSANVICEAALKLGNAFFLEGKRFKRYRDRLAAVDYSLQTISSKNLTAENRLEIILNSLDEGIVCVNESGSVTLVNKEARSMLNVSRSEVLGRPASEVFPELSFRTDGAREEGPKLLEIQGLELGASLTPLTLEGEKLGSFLTLQRFQDAERLQSRLRLQKTRKGQRARACFDDIIGTSPAICRAKDIAARMAENDAAILIQGESGTGKTLFAQAIHNASDRAGEAFVTVSCAALSDASLEAELFGTAGDGQTSDAGGRIGLIECAHRGTLFLNGVEYMSPQRQASLLRVLREKEITRLGSDETVPVDIRVIASAGEDLLKLVQSGRFRRDLYYRLNVMPLDIPPLRKRRQDIPLLLNHFRAVKNADYELTARAKLALLQHRWDGNVRELENCVEYLKYMGRPAVDTEDLPRAIREAQSETAQREAVEQQSGMSMQEFWVMKELGEHYLHQAGIGRRAIAELCLAHGHAVSEHEVRAALDKLSGKGYADVRQGRGGSRLTEEGYLHFRRILYGDEGAATQ